MKQCLSSQTKVPLKLHCALTLSPKCLLFVMDTIGNHFSICLRMHLWRERITAKQRSRYIHKTPYTVCNLSIFGDGTSMQSQCIRTISSQISCDATADVCP